jgi:hypothetical protein
MLGPHISNDFVCLHHIYQRILYVRTTSIKGFYVARPQISQDLVCSEQQITNDLICSDHTFERI